MPDGPSHELGSGALDAETPPLDRFGVNARETGAAGSAGNSWEWSRQGWARRLGRREPVAAGQSRREEGAGMTASSFFLKIFRGESK